MKLGKAFPFVIAISAVFPIAGIVVACSDSSDPEDGGATEAGAGDDAEAGKNDAKSDGSITPTKEGGNCSEVKGECDIVLQECPNDSKGGKQECVVTGSGTNLATKCVPVQSSQQLPMGSACCPGNSNPCLPGLSCVGDECSDGGPKTGRCTPACCKGDDQSCGSSQPEGISGTCDITLFSNDKELHYVCSYRERCKPFGQEKCGANKVCIIEDKVGTAGCISSNNKPLGAPCKFGNDCADGLTCLNLQGSDGGVCRMECLTPGAVHPFDAGVEDGGPFRGGCNPNEACNIGPFQDLPPWLSFCRIDGG